MKKIFLYGARGEGKYALVDNDDYKFLKKWRWFLDTTGYPAVNVRINGFKNRPRLHSVIMKPQKGLEVDHINSNKLDNRKENLRIVTHQQNMQNRIKSTNKTSTYKGVSYSKYKGKWVAQIWRAGKPFFIGSFTTERHAAIAYDMTAYTAWGEFAKLNFPEALIC